jgi:hypothetical protein
VPDRVAFDRVAFDRVAADRVAFDRVAFDRVAHVPIPLSLKEPPAPQWVEGSHAEVATPEAGRAGRVLCALCAARVTDPGLACQRKGAHHHTLTNPAGITFEIVLFSAAPGCARRGASVREHSWFPPAAWAVAACAGCDTQLGWFFDEGGAGFIALIAERIRIEHDEHPK